ncbi:MAG: biotin--[acetyl-CoA-carboxylase] ligase [Gemmatimonadaceae bacterium]
MRGVRYDGVSAESLAGVLDLPRVVLFDVVGSTLDVAHELAAAGAPAGTLVLADAQSAGRGRNGKAWSSAAAAGVWLTIIERPRDAAALQVLSIRLGLRVSAVLKRWAPSPVRVKWPNDLYVSEGKIAGILVESRMREEHVDWVAIGVGVNVRAPEGVGTAAAALREETDRLELLAELVPAIRSAASATGVLSPKELEQWQSRDLARGRRCSAPANGRVVGINEVGSLLVDRDGMLLECRAGSLVLESES